MNRQPRDPAIGSRLFLALPKPPGLDEFPVDIDRVIEMEQQAFSAIEES
jgi:hypothetical protein